MKTITMIGVAMALCIPALASAQRGGGGAGGASAQRVAVQRIDVRRVDVGRVDRGPAINPARDVNVARGPSVVETGTRIRRHDPTRRGAHSQARRRWNAANPNPNPRRRYYNATH
jgi:hypothetical protein